MTRSLTHSKLPVLQVYPGMAQFIPNFIGKTLIYNSIKQAFLPKFVTKKNFSIGMYIGTSQINCSPPDNINNPILTGADVTDVGAVFIADPFMITRF
jgi:hypothetical protein